jgi:eukaryotic-like serine/threonine-protein kinase
MTVGDAGFHAPSRGANRPPGAPADRNLGAILGASYRIVRKIGSGGMADVYEVEHLRLGSRFAAKVLRARTSSDPSARRFLREARLISRLRSDHVVSVFDVSESEDETLFYVMELLAGEDLRRLLTHTPRLSIARVAKIISDACLGLAVVHADGLVHRDLKPENLFVTHRDTGEEVTKLLDFGVVKAHDGTSTEHGGLIGTVRYMAPEQIEQAGHVGPRADVRALGAILYECLAGRPAYAADSLERLMFKILNEPVAPLGAIRPDIPGELERVVHRALARDPLERYSTPDALADALRPFLREGNDATASTTDEGPGRVHPRSRIGRPARSRVFVWMLPAAVVAGSLGYLARSPDPARRARDATLRVVGPSVASASERRPSLTTLAAASRDVAVPSAGALGMPAPAPPSASGRPPEAPVIPEKTPALISGTKAPPVTRGSFVKIDARNPYGP